MYNVQNKTSRKTISLSVLVTEDDKTVETSLSIVFGVIKIGRRDQSFLFSESAP